MTYVLSEIPKLIREIGTKEAEKTTGMKRELVRLKTARAFLKVSSLSHLISGDKPPQDLQNIEDQLKLVSESEMYTISLKNEYDDLSEKYNSLVSKLILQQFSPKKDEKVVENLEKKVKLLFSLLKTTGGLLGLELPNDMSREGRIIPERVTTQQSVWNYNHAALAFNMLIEKNDILDYSKTLKELSNQEEMFSDKNQERTRMMQNTAVVYETSAKYHYPEMSPGELEIAKQTLEITAKALRIELTPDQLQGIAPLPLVGVDTDNSLVNEKVKWTKDKLDDAIVFFELVLIYDTLTILDNLAIEKLKRGSLERKWDPNQDEKLEREITYRSLIGKAISETHLFYPSSRTKGMVEGLSKLITLNAKWQFLPLNDQWQFRNKPIMFDLLRGEKLPEIFTKIMEVAKTEEKKLGFYSHMCFEALKKTQSKLELLTRLTDRELDNSKTKMHQENSFAFREWELLTWLKSEEL